MYNVIVSTKELYGDEGKFVKGMPVFIKLIIEPLF